MQSTHCIYIWGEKERIQLSRLDGRMAGSSILFLGKFSNRTSDQSQLGSDGSSILAVRVSEISTKVSLDNCC